MRFPQAFCNIDELLAHIARFGYSVRNGNRTNVVPLECHHTAELALMHKVNGANAVARGQHAIKSRRRAAALYMAKDHGACLKARAGLDFRCQRVADAAKTHMPKFIRLSTLSVRSAVGKLGAF